MSFGPVFLGGGQGGGGTPEPLPPVDEDIEIVVAGGGSLPDAIDEALTYRGRMASGRRVAVKIGPDGAVLDRPSPLVDVDFPELDIVGDMAPFGRNQWTTDGQVAQIMNHSGTSLWVEAAGLSPLNPDVNEWDAVQWHRYVLAVPVGNWAGANPARVDQGDFVFVRTQINHAGPNLDLEAACAVAGARKVAGVTTDTGDGDGNITELRILVEWPTQIAVFEAAISGGGEIHSSQVFADDSAWFFKSPVVTIPESADWGFSIRGSKIGDLSNLMIVDSRPFPQEWFEIRSPSFDVQYSSIGKRETYPFDNFHDEISTFFSVAREREDRTLSSGDVVFLDSRFRSPDVFSVTGTVEVMQRASVQVAGLYANGVRSGVSVYGSSDLISYEGAVHGGSDGGIYASEFSRVGFIGGYAGGGWIEVYASDGSAVNLNGGFGPDLNSSPAPGITGNYGSIVNLQGW